MEYKQIVFTAPGVAELLDVSEAPLGADQVKVQTVISTISNGTERANLIGDVNVNITKPAEALGTAILPKEFWSQVPGVGPLHVAQLKKRKSQTFLFPRFYFYSQGVNGLC